MHGIENYFSHVDIETVNSDSNETDNTDDLCKQTLMPFPASLMDMLKHPRTSPIDYLLMDPDANLLHCAKTIQDFNLLEWKQTQCRAVSIDRCSVCNGITRS